MYTQKLTIGLKALVICTIASLGVTQLHAQTKDSTNTGNKSNLRIGFGYQIQEFQLLNQNLASDCNCDENASLKDRSLQGYYLTLQLPVKDKWTVGFDLGYSKGRSMNDLKQYTDGDFILAKLEANYLFSTPESKLRPYLTAAAQYYSRPNQKFQGLPLGVGLSARINNSAYLNLQTAYDFGLGNDLAQSLVTGISLRFPLTKSKSSPSSSQEKEKKGVVVLKPIEKPQPAVVQPQATAQASAPAPVAKAETQPAAPAVSNSETVLAVAKPETQPTPQPVSKPETVLAAVKSAPKALTELYKVVYFDTDQALLSRPGTLPTLVEVVDFMNAHPQSKAHLAGHTDLRASIDYNIQLSKKRVTAVYQFLINAGISPDRISVNYFGKSKPATTASAADAMLSNRRTEIWVK